MMTGPNAELNMIVIFSPVFAAVVPWMILLPYILTTESGTSRTIWTVAATAAAIIIAVTIPLALVH